MKVLVTGPDGFVGQHLCASLRTAGHTVVEAPGPNLEGGVDITDGAGVLSVFQAARPDAVVHLAAVSSVAESHREPTRTVAINTLGTTNLLVAAKQACPSARILIVSSGEVYGRLPPGSRAGETARTAPISPYAASKVAAETIALQFHQSYGMDVVCARPFSHLGPGQTRNFVVPSFAAQIGAIASGAAEPILKTGDLSPIRDFLHVLDVVAAYELLLRVGVPGAIYNIASGVGRTVRSLLDEMVDLTGVVARIEQDPARMRPVEIPELVGDATRLRQLGWSNSRTVTDALREVLKEHAR